MQPWLGEASPGSSPGGRTLVVLALLTVPFLALNIATADRSPTVWIDEVLFTDPGVNLALGRGFRSTTSAYQDASELYAANAPLHPLLVAAWVKAFGFSVTGVRSLNYVLVVVLLLLLWDASRRLALIRGVPGAVLLTLLMFGGYAITFSYRSGRYDMLGAALGAALFWLSSHPFSTARVTASIAVAALLPWTGLQLVPYAAAVGIVVLACLGRTSLRTLLPIGLGILLGGAALLLHFAINGVLDDFVRSVTGMSDAASGLGPRAAAVAAGLRTDISSGLLLLLLLAMALDDWRRPSSRWCTPAVAGLLFAIAVPLVVGLSGRWMGYYSWMKFVPMSVCAVAAVTTVRRPPWLMRTAVVLIVVAASGFGARMAVVALEWRSRDYAPVEAFVSSQLGPGDIVYADFAAYYGAKKTASEVYFPPHLAALTGDDKAAITVLVLDPAGLDAVRASIGGQWIERGRYESPPDAVFPGASLLRRFAREGGAFGSYALSVYRRAPE